MRVIITGAARGIGEATALLLAERGDSVILVDRDPGVQDCARQITEQSGNDQLVTVVGDVSDERTALEACDVGTAHFGGVDGLVNNAAIGGDSSLAIDTDVAQFRRILDVNLVGYFVFAKAVANHLRKAGRQGVIVNIGSMFGQRGNARSVAYCAAKGGVALMSQVFALELAQDGIRVNNVAPGNIGTEMHWQTLTEKAEIEGTTLELEVAKQAAEVPLGRLGRPREIAETVAWLLGEGSSYVTGQTIAVNGGVYLS